MHEKQYQKVKLFKYGNLNNESNKIKTKFVNKIKLKPHQRSLLFYMDQLEESFYNNSLQYGSNFKELETSVNRRIM